MNLISLSAIYSVRFLSRVGVSLSEISRSLKVDRGTVRKYSRISEGDLEAVKNAGVIQSAEIGDLKSPQCEFESHAPHQDLFHNNKAKYSYLLGLYLSDGYISFHERTKRLRIALGENETGTQERASKFLSDLFPRNKVSTHKRLGSKCVDVSVYSNKLDQLFPDAEILGGPKHLKDLKVLDWQIHILDMYPREFILGCIHGDGCRYLSGGKYLYYNFTNMSVQIKQLFVGACRAVGIKFPDRFQIERKRVNIYAKENIAILESFWVPK